MVVEGDGLEGNLFTLIEPTSSSGFLASELENASLVTQTRFYVKVVVAADEEFRSAHPNWKEWTEYYIEHIDDYFIQEFGIDFVVVSFVEYVSNDSLTEPYDLFYEMQKKVDKNDANIVVAFSKQYTGRIGGLGELKGDDVIIFEDSPSYIDNVIQHELSHLFGALDHNRGITNYCVMSYTFSDFTNNWDEECINKINSYINSEVSGRFIGVALTDEKRTPPIKIFQEEYVVTVSGYIETPNGVWNIDSALLFYNTPIGIKEGDMLDGYVVYHPTAGFIEAYWMNRSLSLVPPIASFTFTPSTPTVGEIVIFDGSLSFDMDGYIMDYQWDFGDGATGNGFAVSHTYASPGEYNVTLIVTDNDGLTSRTSALITVLGHQDIIIEYSVNPTSLCPGDEMTVNVTIDNLSQFDTYHTLYLIIDGNVVDTSTIYLPPRNTINHAFVYPMLEYGVHNVTINNLPETYVYVFGPGISLSNLQVNPLSGKAPLNIVASAEITNLGICNIATNYPIDLSINGESVDYKIVQINPNESITVTFNYTLLTPGEYVVSMDGLEGILVNVLIPTFESNVTRSLPSSAEPDSIFNVTLTSTASAIGMQITETIPAGFTFINYSASGANSVTFQQNGNQLTFTVTDIAADGFTVIYILQAPSDEGVYSFTGTFEALGQDVAMIGGDTVLEVTTGETVPDNVDDTLEQLVSKYNPDFDWRTETPSKQDVMQAVVNAVIQYFGAQNQTEKQQILSDVVQLVVLYFTIES